MPVRNPTGRTGNWPAFVVAVKNKRVICVTSQRCNKSDHDNNCDRYSAAAGFTVIVTGWLGSETSVFGRSLASGSLLNGT